MRRPRRTGSACGWRLSRRTRWSPPADPTCSSDLRRGRRLRPALTDDVRALLRCVDRAEGDSELRQPRAHVLRVAAEGLLHLRVRGMRTDAAQHVQLRAFDPLQQIRLIAPGVE